MSAREEIIREQIIRKFQRESMETAPTTSSESEPVNFLSRIRATYSPSSADFTPLMPNFRGYSANQYSLPSVPDVYVVYGTSTGSDLHLLAGQRFQEYMTLGHSTSPFTELLTSKIAEAKAAVSRALALLAIPEFANRISQLIDDAKEEYPETKIPAAQSIDSALKFFAFQRQLREPAISLTSSGNIWAEWRMGANHTAALEFLRNGAVHLAAIAPDPDEPWRQSAIAGSFSKDEAARLLSTVPSLTWTRR